MKGRSIPDAGENDSGSTFLENITEVIMLSPYEANKGVKDTTGARKRAKPFLLLCSPGSILPAGTSGRGGVGGIGWERGD